MGDRHARHRGEPAADVRFVQGSGLDLATLVPTGHFGTVFMSNYLEHLPSAEAVVDQLRVARRLLRPSGRVIVLQPNIRLVGASATGTSSTTRWR